MKHGSLISYFLLIMLLGLPVMGRGNAAADEGQPAAAEQTAKVYLPAVVNAPGTQTGALPVIHSFTASPATIQSGGSATLAWQVSGASSLSISPGTGAVTGTSVAVSPAATTRYTLTATNSRGSASAAVTVNVVTASSPPDGFFVMPSPNIELPTSHPTARVDSQGGVHVVFTPQSANAENPARAAYYAYCAANCTSAAAFGRIPLGEGVDFASLDLDPAGRPRVLLRVPVQSGAIFLFQYWECNGNCLNPAQWAGNSIGYTYTPQVGWVIPFIHSFALDNLGRPRFVYYDNGADYEDPHTGVFYAFCDNNCTAPASWYETRLLDDSHATDFHLAFSPTGQPRLVYASYNSEQMTQPVMYAECNQNCGQGANWSGVVLANTVNSGVSHWATFSLDVASNGRPRVALYTGTGSGGSLTPNTLYYLACQASSCAQAGAWAALDLNFPDTHGEEGVSLALDAQDRPRIAYHAPMTAGFGLYYAACNTSCETSAQGWQTQKIEASEAVNAELPIPVWPGCAFPQCNPPIPPCTVSTWDTGVRPSLALSADGRPRIAYDADHRQGGACGTFVDTKLTRFVQFNP